MILDIESQIITVYAKNLHGHRYSIEVTIKGEIREQISESDFGMVMDFKDAKNLIKKVIVDQWDHAFIAYERDLEVISFLNTLDNHKTVILKRVPHCRKYGTYRP